MTFVRGSGSVVCVVALYLASLIGLAALSVLIDHARLVLLVLRPSTEVILLTEKELPALLILAIVVPLRTFFHIAYYELGRWAGGLAVERMRAGRWLLPKLRHPMVVGLVLASCLIHQSTPVDLALGAQRADRRMAYPAIAAGVLMWTCLLIYLGARFATGLGQVSRLITEHRLAVVVVLVPVILITMLLFLGRLRRTMRRS
ncbi:hypothetical protein ACRYCC_35045 [Actinomadura scrupuli]|uniref:hypothetical protein n=1 Tax=Actinomadura scrupuli TaxID=559629 RepID=UPI003D99666D